LISFTCASPFSLILLRVLANFRGIIPQFDRNPQAYRRKSADLPNLPALLRLDGQRAGCAVAVIPTNELSLMSDIVPFLTAMTGASSLSDQL